MKTVNIEHNLTEYELLEVLQKGLAGAEIALARPERFEEAFMQRAATNFNDIVER